MSTRGTKALVALALLVYVPVLLIGLKQRRAAEQAAEESARITAEAARGSNYAQSHNGEWPRLASTGPTWAYSAGTAPENYVLYKPTSIPANDGANAILLGHLNKARAMTLKPAFSVDDYFYLGYAVTSEEEGLALIDAVRKAESLDGDIPVEPGKGTLGSSSFYRLHSDLPSRLARDGVIKDPNSVQPKDIPVIIQRLVGSFTWVVYLDLHSERLAYPGPFPATEQFIEALESTRE